MPGLVQEFNDWYTNTHMGDLVQLDDRDGLVMIAISVYSDWP